MTLRKLNALDAGGAADALRRCCGSTQWARQMAALRPFASAEAVAARADAIWRDLEREDWLEAFAAHPKIGESASGGAGSSEQQWSDEEQRGVADAADAVRDRLAKANRDYEARFGYIFIVCATGKAAAEILDLITERLTNDAAAELAVAAEEQRKITRLRLARLLGENG
jgi:2-oxo-4-hydroxy-4-carboxy-5-ureidoimidazoline decarboxylase